MWDVWQLATQQLYNSASMKSSSDDIQTCSVVEVTCCCCWKWVKVKGASARTKIKNKHIQEENEKKMLVTY